MKITVTAPFKEHNKSLLTSKALDNEIVFSDKEKDITDSEILIGDTTNEIFRKCHKLKWLQSTNAGVEKFCTDKLLSDDVIITNVTGAFGDTIAEYVIGGILSLYRDFYSYYKNKKEHIWQDTRKERMISGSTVLILGCGNIGKALAERLKPFGAYIIGVRSSDIKDIRFDEIYTSDKLCDVISRADIIIGCLPHTRDTDKLLSADILDGCKPDALIVNVGRGTLMDYDRLYKKLSENKLFGAVLDVFPTEPLPKDSPLWDMDNVIITPHISGCSFFHSIQTENKIAEICADNLSRFLCGKPLINIIDKNKGYV